MTNREERRHQRISRLLEHLRAAARREVKPPDGSAVKTSFADRRERAEQKLKALLRELREAMKR
jgi:hypothetical protein